jgi:Zn-dependent oligopeptidase
MSTTIAEYYTDELVEWNDSINFYSKEMDKLEQKLGEVISRNSIVGIAEKVEAHQTLLNELSDKFHRLQIEIQQQEAVFKTDSTLVDNTLSNNETGMRQAELRRKMQTAEKEYIDVKFDCYNFLSQTLKK